MKRILVLAAIVLLASCTHPNDPLPRGKAPAAFDEAFASYLQAVADSAEQLHSIMVLQHGKVLAEHFFVPDTAHILNSVSKTFTSTAVGFAIEEGLLSLDDKIVDLFPESLPERVSDTLARVTIRHLLTMNSGHGKDPTYSIRSGEGDWVKGFMEWPFDYEPGTCYCYNSLGTYVLSAAVQKVSGQKVVDYLEPRLWQPLGIEKPYWQESPAGINTGGWGLFLKTEDLARMGLCLLNGGKFRGKQVIPADWVKEMSAAQVPSVSAGVNERQVSEIRQDPAHPFYAYFDPAQSDWQQGYGYQMWRCRHGAFRADGANGQYILVLPEQDAVIVTTAHIQNMRQELNLIWDHLLPALGGAPKEKTEAVMREIKPTEIKENPVALFDECWALVTAGVPGNVNTMTISWGSLGELWNKPVVTVYVSSSRYTHEFMERNDRFTVAFFPEKYRQALSYLGSHSGRDSDKITESGLTLEFLASGQPSFAEADMVIEARKLYGAPFDAAALDAVPAQFYASRGMGIHSIFIGEIEHVWLRNREGEQ
ncbi:MAG: serine hydrolase [Bacteroidales bacterium]|nr:serine hydrolase [Bacteroidales bacterium]